tara:strand:+ start:9748 stop:10611 length:864 start_codon:yes stop_codon:yes gene_type:complete
MNTNSKLTILTATYNRAAELNKLYDSLVCQTNNDFTWLIVDDGSTDDTETTVNKFMRGNKIEINYIKKNNEGKHSALNVGFNHISADWSFVVDSDDWLDMDCVDTINSIIKGIDDEDIASITMLQKNSKGLLVGSSLFTHHSNFLHMINGGVTGDKCDVFRTSIVKRFVFPVFNNERFMSELPLYLWLGINYKSLFVNYCGYNCEYLPGGLSDETVRLRYKNSKSTLFVYESLFKSPVKLTLKFRAAINWWRFYFGRRHDTSASWKPPFYLSPLGFLFFLHDRLKYE